MLTQSQLAQHLGMPRTTVAAALNPRLASRLRPEVRQRVRDAARKLSYVPHHAARRLASLRPDSRGKRFDQVGLISVIQPGAGGDAVWHALLEGAEQVLADVQSTLCFVRVSKPADWEKVERLTLAGNVDGWLLYGQVNDEAIDRLRVADLPHVILGDHQCTRPVHSVNIDNVAVGRMAAQHLASLGHRRIFFITPGDMPYTYERQTLSGFRAAVKELGLDDDERLVGRIDESGGLDWLRQTRPTALFTPEFDWAMFVHGLLNKSQVKVPEDVSILAYETASATARLQNFTRIQLPLADVGQEGAKLLHRIATSEDGGETPARIRVAPALIEGWSTAGPALTHQTDLTNSGGAHT